MASKKEIKKVKLNDKVNKKRVKKQEKYISDEARAIRSFIFIILGISIVVLGVYGITKALKKDKTSTDEENVRAGAIDYDVVSIGTMLNRNEDEYYVALYDAEDSKAVLYSAIINKYLGKDKAKSIYFCDLGNAINSNYYVGKDKESNPNAKSIEELALGDLTFIKVKKGKIVKYIEDIDTIKQELGI